jgi:large subunit ribosomal protein L25
VFRATTSKEHAEMADQIALTADPRAGDGKGEARALRKLGRVPAIAYGADLENTALHVDERELRHALSTHAGENAVISLTFDGSKHLTMPREIHRHPVRRTVLHLDFVAINAKVAVTVEVPLIVLGDGPEGAIVNQALNVVTIEVLPLQVPDGIEVSVEGLEVGDVIRAGDITLPEGVTLLDDPERTAVSVTLPDVEPVEDDETVDGEVTDAEASAEDEDEGDADAEGDAE